jgi:hypothetical protein
LIEEISMARRPKTVSDDKKLSLGSALDEGGFKPGKRIKVKPGDVQRPLRRLQPKRPETIPD